MDYNSSSSNNNSGIFSSSGRGSGIKDFLNSNSLIARFSFFLLILFVFIIILNVLVRLLSKILSRIHNTPKLVDGLIEASSNSIIIPQDPSSNGAITINRSVNGPNGVEFTWSVWFFINSLAQPNNKRYQHIFSKGNNPNIGENGLYYPNNAPGMYLYPDTNNLLIIMNTYEKINEEITIKDIPINKWVNVILRCRNKTLDVYINGTITKSVNLSGVPKQNYGDIFVAMNGGFNGYLSDLRYYDYALGLTEITTLSSAGANLKVSSQNTASLLLGNPDYLSLRWYFYGSNGKT